MTEIELLRKLVYEEMLQTQRPPLRLIITLMLKQGELIMATLAELQQKIDDQSVQITNLETTLDTEQQQVADALAGLTQQIADQAQNIADLTAMIDASPTPEELQTLADALTANNTKLETIKADLEGTVTPTSEAPPPVDPNALPMGFSASGTVGPPA